MSKNSISPLILAVAISLLLSGCHRQNSSQHGRTAGSRCTIDANIDSLKACIKEGYQKFESMRLRLTVDKKGAYWQYLISGFFALLIAVVEGIAARDRKRAKDSQAKAEARSQRREDAVRLTMRMMNASLDLGVATAIAVEEHRTNGEMKAARETADKVQADYHKFLEQISAEELTKK